MRAQPPLRSPAARCAGRCLSSDAYREALAPVVAAWLVMLALLAAPAAAEPPQPGVGPRASAEDRARFETALNDLWTTVAAKSRLVRNREIPGLEIDVDARDGVITLFGMVPSLSAQAAAELELLKIDGVRRIENLLEVVPQPDQEATRAHDDALARVVRERLAARPELAGARLGVAVCNAVARLEGRVESLDLHQLAVETVRDTVGVRKVVGRLEIGEPASAHAASY